MLKSMTGFGSAQAHIPGVGKVACELRSINHRFLEIIFHLPEGFSCLEEGIRTEVEKKVLRGRIICVLKFISAPKQKVMIDARTLKEYFSVLDKTRKELRSEAPIDISSLISLPGVLGLQETIDKSHIWPGFKGLVSGALDNLVRVRTKEGRALTDDLRKRTHSLENISGRIALRFKKIIKTKAGKIDNLDERSAFIKDADITEELVRVRFHLKNFLQKLNKNKAVGKELDFIAQELQRETNTIGAKSVDAMISGNVVVMKSEIEKVREQLQNVE